MPFDRPTLTTLRDRVIGDFDTRLPGADARLPHSVLNVLAVTHAGAAHELYGYVGWLARQLIYDTAETEYLERWAAIWGVTRKAATYASGSASFEANASAEVPTGTLVQRRDGVQFAVTADAAEAGGSIILALKASEPGAAGNTAVAAGLELVSPVEGVAAAGVVAAGGLTGGGDPETDDQLRDRFLLRIRQRPHGGAAHDYVRWVLDTPSVGATRAWALANHLGLGTVGVTFVKDEDPVSIIPAQADLDAVAAYIDHPTRRPVTADVTVFAPTPVALDFTIAVAPDTAEVRAAVEASLADLLKREAEPGATILISHIREAVSLATGETDHVVSAPAADVTHDTGEMAVMGAITWV